MGAISGDMELLIRAPSRLHLGFIPSEKGLGSAAVAISEPSLIMRMRKSDGIHVRGAYSDEFFRLASSFIENFSPEGGVDILVESAIKRHIGLGSGTRMALSVGMGVDRLYGLKLDPHDIAEFFGRGRNSRAGLETLLHGGMVLVDGKTDILSIPDDWRFVVAIPEISHSYFGAKERKAMESMTPPNLERDIGAEMRDAIGSRDVELFGELITELDRLTGMMFQHVQGGEHTHESLSKIKDFGLKAGAYGAGQSSWGPAIYFLTDEGHSDELVAKIREYMHAGDVFSTRISKKGIEMSM